MTKSNKLVSICFALSPLVLALLGSVSVQAANKTGLQQQKAAFDSEVLEIGDTLMLPAPDLAKIQLEDSKSVGGPYRYGVQIPLRDKSVSGKWSLTADGRMRYTMKLASPGATSLDLHFSKLVLPKGAILRLIGEGVGNERKILASEIQGGEYWSPYVLGEQVRIEIEVAARRMSAVAVELASVTHGYRGLFEREQPYQKSGACNVDTICPAGDAWRDQIDSVGHYTFSKNGSSFVCTGSLIGNTNRDTTPYFLTANHCVGTATVAGTMVVYWNYQSTTCRTPGSSASGTPLSRGIASHSQSGTTLVASNAASDFTLVRLNANVPSGANPYWTGWDATGTAPSSAVGIHHPKGHEKRIAVENQALTVSGYNGASGSSHWRVNDWDQGTTEGGSSGSGLWNQNKRLVGQLHGGSAACGNDLSDYYGRLSVSWNGGGTNATRLSNWLNPSGGTTSMDGYRASGGRFFQNTADFAIGDNTTVDSPITVSGVAGNAPATLSVAVNIVHTYQGDLKVDLVAPDGTLYNIHNRTGSSADNVIKTVTINASSEVANGTWKLRVNDNAGGDTGYINSWSMQF